MTRRTSLRFALTLAAVAASAIPLSGTAAAHDDACGTTHDMGTSTTGAVSATNPADWWRNSVSTNPRTFTLTPAGGDADLAVYSDDCSTLLCSSAAGSVAVDSCTVYTSAPVQVEVSHYSGALVSYELSSASAYPSEDCVDGGLGTDVVTGFAGDTYVTLRTQRTADATWVCARIDDGVASYGGKLVVPDYDGAPPALPRVDGSYQDCANATPNTEPTANILNTVVLDVYTGASNEAWVCLLAPGISRRVVVPTGLEGTLPSYSFQRDMAGSRTYDREPLPVASGDCQRSPYPTSRWADLSTNGIRSYLYTTVGYDGTTTVCVRAGDEGGRLVIQDTTRALPRVTSASDATGCTLPVVVAGYGVSVGRGTDTSHVCLFLGGSVLRVTVQGGDGLMLPVWTGDQDGLVP